VLFVSPHLASHSARPNKRETAHAFFSTPDQPSHRVRTTTYIPPATYTCGAVQCGAASHQGLALALALVLLGQAELAFRLFLAVSPSTFNVLT
jgi:hypothetical protein